MTELHNVLDGLVRGAPTESADWDDVVARSRSKRRRPVRRPLVLAAALALLLALAGTAVSVSVSLLAQQERFHAQLPDDPQRVGPLVEITSGERWALIAWRSNVGLCLDFAVPDNSPFACGLPVRGTASSGGSGPPVHAVDGFFSGSNLVGVSDGKATIFGVAANDVSEVQIELSDGRLIKTQLFDAPPKLVDRVKLFIVRLRLGALERTGLTGSPPVTAYRAYDRNGRLMERFRP